MRILTYPVNRIPRRDPRPRKGRIGLRFLSSAVPTLDTLLPDITELRQAARMPAPAEVVNDKAFDASGLGGVHHDCLEGDACWTYNAHDCIMNDKRGGQCGWVCVIHADDMEVGRKGCRGLGAADGCDVEAGGEKGVSDGDAKVAAGIQGVPGKVSNFSNACWYQTLDCHHLHRRRLLS
jgi:hypothetical protein